MARKFVHDRRHRNSSVRLHLTTGSRFPRCKNIRPGSNHLSPSHVTFWLQKQSNRLPFTHFEACMAQREKLHPADPLGLASKLRSRDHTLFRSDGLEWGQTTDTSKWLYHPVVTSRAVNVNICYFILLRSWGTVRFSGPDILPGPKRAAASWGSGESNANSPHNLNVNVNLIEHLSLPITAFRCRRRQNQLQPRPSQMG